MIKDYHGIGMSGFVFGITTQLGTIDSNRRLSRIVRNLMEPHHRSNWIMEYDGFDEYENITLAMLTIVMLLNDIPHVW